MIGRTAKRRSILVHRPNAMRHLGTTLSSFHDSFYLSHLSRSPSSRAERMRCQMEFRRSHLLFLGRASTSRICNKEDRCDGRNIANLLLFHSARSSSFIRYSLESTLFHRQSDTVRATLRYERLNVRKLQRYK